ncbi:HET domain-containing protein [Microdochium nivale]|nr:HET domain-containing protein [Microdochium nivale]
MTANLYDVLQWCSRNRPLASLWNQSDLEEKSHQIGLMGVIYEKAYKTVCWLGPPTPRVDLYLRWKPILTSYNIMDGI